MSTTIYINRDDTGHVQAVSTTYTSATNNEASLDDDAFYFDKLEGYKATYDTEGKLHVAFDQTQYDAYTKAQAEAEAKAKEEEKKQDKQDEILNQIIAMGIDIGQMKADIDFLKAMSGVDSTDSTAEEGA